MISVPSRLPSAAAGIYLLNLVLLKLLQFPDDAPVVPAIFSHLDSSSEVPEPDGDDEDPVGTRWCLALVKAWAGQEGECECECECIYTQHCPNPERRVPEIIREGSHEL